MKSFNLPAHSPPAAAAAPITARECHIQGATRGFADCPVTWRVPKFSRLGEHRAHPSWGLNPPLQAQPELSFLPQTRQSSARSWHQPITPNPLHGTAPPAPTRPRQELCHAGGGLAEGRGYSHMPPMTPAILQSHLYHQVMPSSAEAAAASGAAAAAGNGSSCELILPQPPGAQRPAAHLSPPPPRCHPLLQPPLKAGLALSPCPHSGPGPPRADNGGCCGCRAMPAGPELLHCCLQLHCGSPPAAGRALPLMSLALKGCGQSSAARIHQRRHSHAAQGKLWMPPGSTGCCHPGKAGFAFPERETGILTLTGTERCCKIPLAR